MVCYTRNFEDVILQRVFADRYQGCYLDVGAYAPVVDSNTFALYQKGWRGVAMEPLPYERLWETVRPGDLFVRAAAGAQNGHVVLQVFDSNFQLSSGSAHTVTHLSRVNVMPSTSMAVQMLTLDTVIADHLPEREIHLLSIDVEGMELQALRGLNLRKHRPWVVVVEAVVPGSPVAAHQAWEPLLLQADYQMVYFDGVNRFYLGNERGDLARHFKLPPNVWDRFRMARELELEAEVARLTSELAALKPG
jgi:FkbM family methyltransferase